MSAFHLKFNSRSFGFFYDVSFSLMSFPFTLQNTLIVTTADSEGHKSDMHEHMHDALQLNTLCALLHSRMTVHYFTDQNTIYRNTDLTR
jgi:hypothetical protein